MERFNGYYKWEGKCNRTQSRVDKWKWSLSLHRAFRRITLIINQQMHLHKISH